MKYVKWTNDKVKALLLKTGMQSFPKFHYSLNL